MDDFGRSKNSYKYSNSARIAEISPGGETFKFFVNGGGYGSYALNGKSTSTINGTKSSVDIKYTKDDPRLEYGAVGGAGISFGLGGAHIAY
ncbi:MAG: hypothetical protein R2822_20900 [Spirosomataceae bacterium]